MRTGKLTPQSTANIKANIWVKAYETTLTEATTSLTISGLTGDTDKEYKLEARIVNGYNGESSAILYLNNDTGSNYGFQYVRGIDTAVNANRATQAGVSISNASTLGGVSQSAFKIFAKSGNVRTLIKEDCFGIAGTTVTIMGLFGMSWNNTADNITSLVIAASQAGGLGVGTNIVLWKRSYK